MIHTPSPLRCTPPLLAIACAVLLMATGCRSVRTQPRPSPLAPNILFVVTDDQRADHMGCAGHPFLQTPTMDRLAARGTRFENAFVTTAICAASRASLLTARHESSHGYTFGTPPLALRHATSSYPAQLWNAGYRTGFVGKFGIRTEPEAPALMFDSFRPRNHPYEKPPVKDGEAPRHLTDIIADDAIAFLDQPRDGRPFCLSVSFHAPHAQDGDPRQYIWPAAVDGLYDDVQVPPPANSDPEFFAALPPAQQESLNRIRWYWRFDTEDKRQQMVHGYWRMITGLDRALARILNHLDATGDGARTIVVFTSDNGYFLGERGFAGKWTAHEVSIRVPLIVHDPRTAQAPRVRDEMVLNLDLAPTMLELAGVAIPDEYEGRSLVPLLADANPAAPPQWRDEMFYEHGFEHPDIPRCVGIRTQRWKYARSHNADGSQMWEELYDLDADPDESHNLADEPSLRAELERLRDRTDELADRYRAAGGGATVDG